MLFNSYSQAALVLHEGHSRRLPVPRLPAGKAADPIALAIGQALGNLPAAARQTIAFDNGAEFDRHYRRQDLGIATYFCATPAAGRRAAWRTALAGCAAFCPGAPTWRLCPRSCYGNGRGLTITRPERV